jgi:hypothetical protein
MSGIVAHEVHSNIQLNRAFDPQDDCVNHLSGQAAQAHAPRTTLGVGGTAVSDTNRLPVQMAKDYIQITEAPITRQEVYTLALNTPNAEYHLELPFHVRHYEVQARESQAVRLAWTWGKVAGATEPYRTIKAGAVYSSPLQSQDAEPQTLYFAAEAACTVEIVLSV